MTIDGSLISDAQGAFSTVFGLRGYTLSSRLNNLSLDARSPP